MNFEDWVFCCLDYPAIYIKRLVVLNPKKDEDNDDDNDKKVESIDSFRFVWRPIIIIIIILRTYTFI